MLPATTFLEREDFPLPFLGLFTKPFINMTEAVVEPSGEARQEWEIVEDIAARVGVVPSSVAGDAAARQGRDQAVAAAAGRDCCCGSAPRATASGCAAAASTRSGCARAPHGIVLAEDLEAGVLARKVRHDGGRVQLCPAEIVAEVESLCVARRRRRESASSRCG